MNYLVIILKLALFLGLATSIEFIWPNASSVINLFLIVILCWNFWLRKEMRWLFLTSLALIIIPELQVQIVGPLEVHHVFLLVVFFYQAAQVLKIFRETRKFPSVSKLLFGLFAFLFFSLALTIGQYEQIESWHRVFILLFLSLIVFLMPFVLNKLLYLKELFWTLVIAVSTASFVGLTALYFSIFNESYFTNPYLHISTVEGVPRLAGTLLDSNFLGHYLLLVIPVLLTILAYAKKLDLSRNIKNWLYILLLINLAVTFLTYSRSSYLGLGTALLVLMVLMYKQLKTKNLLTKLVVPTLLGLVVATTLYPSFIFFSVYRTPDTVLPTQLKQTIMGDFDPTKLVENYRNSLQANPNLTEAERDNLLARDVSSDSLGYRLNYWRAAWAMFKAHPWTGVGVGQFRYQYKNFTQSETTELPDTHNIYLELLAETGIIGALVFICVLASSLINLLRLRNHKNLYLRMASIAGAASILGLLVQSVLLGGLGAIAIFILMGLAATLPSLAQYKNQNV